MNSNYDKYIGRFNNKRIVTLFGINPKHIQKSRLDILESGLYETVLYCNKIQKEVEIGLSSIQNNDGSITYTLIVPDSCPYNEETLRSFVTSQSISLIGIAKTLFDASDLMDVIRQ